MSIVGTSKALAALGLPVSAPGLRTATENNLSILGHYRRVFPDYESFAAALDDPSGIADGRYRIDHDEQIESDDGQVGAPASVRTVSAGSVATSELLSSVPYYPATQPETDAAAQIVASRYAPYDIRRYGTGGAALIAVLNAASAGHKAIIAAGSWSVESSLMTSYGTAMNLLRKAAAHIGAGAKIEIVGDGTALATIRNADLNSGGFAVYAEDCEYVALRNLTLDGNSNDQNYTGSFLAAGVAHLVLDDIDVHHDNPLRFGGSLQRPCGLVEIKNGIRIYNSWGTWSLGGKSGGFGRLVADYVYSENGRGGLSLECERLESPITITSQTYADGVVTATFSAAHNALTGQLFWFNGATQEAYDGTYAVTVLDSTRLTYRPINAPTVTPATGSSRTGRRQFAEAEHAEVAFVHCRDLDGEKIPDNTTQTDCVIVQDGVREAVLGTVVGENIRSLSNSSSILNISSGQTDRAPNLVSVDHIIARSAQGTIRTDFKQTLPAYVGIENITIRRSGGVSILSTLTDRTLSGTLTHLRFGSIDADRVVNPYLPDNRASLIVIDNAGVKKIVDTLEVASISVGSCRTNLFGIRDVRVVKLGRVHVRGDANGVAFESYASGQFYLSASIWIAADIIEIDELIVEGSSPSSLCRFEVTTRLVIRGGVLSKAGGAGIILAGPGDHTLQNLTISDNGGRGLDASGAIGTVTLDNVRFANNVGGTVGANVLTGAAAIVTRNVYGWLRGSVTWDPALIAVGARASTTVAVTDARLGDTVTVFAPYALLGLDCWGSVTANNTVTIYLANGTAAGIDLASGVWRVRVDKDTRV